MSEWLRVVGEMVGMIVGGVVAIVAGVVVVIVVGGAVRTLRLLI